MNAIILMAIGDRYTRLLDAVKGFFVDYASYCKAELLVCEAPPDPSFKRNLLCQKMLLPSLYHRYEWIAYFDIDVILSSQTPSIFDCSDDRFAFMAVVDRRSSIPFENVVRHYWKKPSILSETHESYFSDRGFPDHPFPKASINGGVWLCKPADIAESFRSMYFSDAGAMIHEEATMAYVAQRANLFCDLDYRWNTQVLYEIFASMDSSVARIFTTRRFHHLQRYHSHAFPSPEMYPDAYVELVNSRLADSYCLHFSGELPFINLESDMIFNGYTWPPPATNTSRWQAELSMAGHSVSHMLRSISARLGKLTQAIGWAK